MSTSYDSLLDRLAANAKKHPKMIAAAFITPGPNGGKLAKELSYAELALATDQLARHLLDNGLVKGDRYVKLCNQRIVLY